jgi:dTDP-4-amino-4,6-dideoxygalactose transaminase
MCLFGDEIVSRPFGSKNKNGVSMVVEKPIAPEVIVKKDPEFIVFGKPDIGEAEEQAVLKVMRSGWLGTGKVSRKFEEKFSEIMDGGYSVAISSCTMGLQLALRVCGLGDKKEVITSPLTFSATVNAIIREGAKPVFADVDERGCLDPDRVKLSITKDTHGVLPVHYTGSPVDMASLMMLANHYDLKVIEDAAHAFGGDFITKSHDDKIAAPKKLGTIGDYGVFSFYSTKNITCVEGGMVITKYGDMAERIRALSNQGQTSGAWNRYLSGPIHPYEVIHDGYKGNLPDILAAIGLTQLERWDELKAKRAKIWKIYEDNFGLKDQGHSQHLYTIRVKNRDHFRQKLWELGIGTGVHYTALHLEPAFKYMGYKIGDFPMAEKIGQETVSLPISTTMTEDDAFRVVKSVKLIREAVDGN